MTIPPAGRILAVDWGERRIGLALSDETQTIATPLGTITRRAGKRFRMPEFLAHVTTHRPVGLVVGLPLTPDGDDGPSAVAARELAATPLPEHHDRLAQVHEVLHSALDRADP